MTLEAYQHSLASSTSRLSSLDPLRQSAHRSIFVLIHALHLTEHDPCLIITFAQLAFPDCSFQKRRHFR